MRDRIIPIQDQASAGQQKAKNCSFCFYIFFKSAMIVQVVWCKICNCRTGRAAAHIHQLKGGKFDNSQIIWSDFLDIRQQRSADIAAKMNGMTGALQNFAGKGRGRSLAVRTGNSDHWTGTKLKEKLHFAGNQSSGLSGFTQCRMFGVDSRRAENYIFWKVVKVMLTEHECCAQFCQCFILCTQLSLCFFVMDNNGQSCFPQAFNQGHMADPCTDYSDLPAVQPVQIFFKCCHRNSLLFLVSSLSYTV